jgi:hypothetical protein
MNKLEFKLPTPMLIGKNYRFWRSEVEHEKRRLRALSMHQKEPEYQRPEIDELISSAQFSKEFAISTRTLMRRIKEYSDSFNANAADDHAA